MAAVFQYIKGTYVEQTKNFIVLENNGIGYKIHISQLTVQQLPALGSDILLYLYLVVREDSLTFYGFSEKAELSFFKLLTSVSGIGPKLALSLLGCLSISEIFQAIMAQNVDVLTQVKGMGKKTAQRVILELKDKVSSPMIETSEKGFLFAGILTEVREALLSLGYTRKEADETLTAISKTGITERDKLIRESLKHLSERGM